MELTVDQARTYLASVGIAIPDFMLELLVGQANSIEPCLIASGYDPSTALLIKLYLLGLLGTVQGDRYVTSQTAPSGASQSFRFGSLSERYGSIRALLRNLDKFGCADGLIPDDPTAKGAFFAVATGGCCE